MRHYVGSCIARQLCGAACARLVHVHEVPSIANALFIGGNFEDTPVDMQNNEVGIELGKEKVDCQAACWRRLLSGRVIVCFDFGSLDCGGPPLLHGGKPVFQPGGEWVHD